MTYKFIITGMHSSGIDEVIKNLNVEFGLKTGRIFINDLNIMPEIYETCTSEEINALYNSNAYIYFKKYSYAETVKNYNNIPVPVYECLSQEEWDNNDIFAVCPSQVASIFSNKIKTDNIIWLWMDSNYIFRKEHFNALKYNNYSLKQMESIDKDYNELFIDKIYSSGKLLYFNNEEPERVATIVYTLKKYPDLIDFYVKHFNN